MSDTFPPPDAPPPEDPPRVELPPPPQMPTASPSLPSPPVPPASAGPPPSTPPPIRYEYPAGPPTAWASSPIPAPPPYEPPPPGRSRVPTVALVIALLLLGVVALVMTSDDDRDEVSQPSEFSADLPQRTAPGDDDAIARRVTNMTLAYSREEYADMARVYFSTDSQALCGGPSGFADALAAVHDEIGPTTVEFDRILGFDGSEVEFQAVVTEPGSDTPSTVTYGVPVVFEDGDWHMGTQWPPLVADVCGGSFAVEVNQDSFIEEGRTWPFKVWAAWFSCWEDGATVYPFVDIEGQRWSVDPDLDPPEGILPMPDDWELWAEAPEGGKLPLDDAAFLARDVCI